MGDEPQEGSHGQVDPLGDRVRNRDQLAAAFPERPAALSERSGGGNEEGRHRLEFYEDQTGRQPVREWIKNDLLPAHRRTLGAAMREILEEQGIGICGTSFGRQLGDGLFEFRLREEDLLLRVFCHAYGRRVILLLGGYDKGQDPSERRQQLEIQTARKRLRDWERRSRR